MVPIPKLPETLSCCEVKLVADVTPNVEIPETLSWVTDAIPPIILVAIPLEVAKVALEALPLNPPEPIIFDPIEISVALIVTPDPT